MTIGERIAEKLFLVIDGQEQIKRYDKDTVIEIVNAEIGSQAQVTRENKEEVGIPPVPKE